MRSARVPKLGPQPGEQRVPLVDLGRHQSEEGVMLHACFPQLFGRPMIGQLETNRGLELFELARSNFDVEIVTFVANFQNFRPGKTVDAQPISVDQQTGRAHPQHYVHSFGIFSRV